VHRVAGQSTAGQISDCPKESFRLKWRGYESAGSMRTISDFEAVAESVEDSDLGEIAEAA
jgi:hypothetical protein